MPISLSSLRKGSSLQNLADMQAAYTSANEVQQAAFKASVSGGGDFGNTACVIGDSIEACEHISGIPNASWFEYFCSASGGALISVGNLGITGNNTAQMLARFQSAIDTGARYIFIKEAANDVGQGVTIAQNRANKRAMVEMALAANRVPVLVGSSPFKLLISPFTTYNIQGYNISDEMLAREYKIPFITPFDTCYAPDGGWVSSAYSIDSLHPTSYACRIAGERAWAQWSRDAGVLQLASVNTDPNGLVPNCLFQTSSDGYPTGWSEIAGASSAVASAGSEAIGNWWTLTLDGVSDAPAVSSLLDLTIPDGWQAGDILRFSGKIKTVGCDAAGSAGNLTYSSMPKTSVLMMVNFTGPTGATGSAYLGRFIGSDAIGTYSAQTALPAGTTGAYISVFVWRTAVVVAAYSFAQAQVHNLSAPYR